MYHLLNYNSIWMSIVKEKYDTAILNTEDVTCVTFLSLVVNCFTQAERVHKTKNSSGNQLTILAQKQFPHVCPTTQITASSKQELMDRQAKPPKFNYRGFPVWNTMTMDSIFRLIIDLIDFINVLPIYQKYMFFRIFMTIEIRDISYTPGMPHFCIHTRDTRHDRLRWQMAPANEHHAGSLTECYRLFVVTRSTKRRLLLSRGIFQCKQR